MHACVSGCFWGKDGQNPTPNNSHTMIYWSICQSWFVTASLTRLNELNENREGMDCVSGGGDTKIFYWTLKNIILLDIWRILKELKKKIPSHTLAQRTYSNIAMCFVLVMFKEFGIHLQYIEGKRMSVQYTHTASIHKEMTGFFWLYFHKAIPRLLCFQHILFHF